MHFRIKAVDSNGAVLAYGLDALDEAEARRQVEARGCGVVSIAAAQRWLSVRGRRGRIQLVQFSQELVSLLEAGLSLVESLQTLSEKDTGSGQRQIIAQLLARLFEGRTLASAMAEHPQIFPPVYVAAVRASERTSALPDALKRFVAYQVQVDALRKTLLSACIYPAVLTVAGALVTLFLLVYVVPRFSLIYDEMGSALPLASRLLLEWGRFLEAHTWAVVFAALLGVGTFVWAALQERARAWARRQVSRIPTIGRQLFLYQLARFFRTIGILLRGGIPVVSALEMSAGLLSPDLRPRLADAVKAIREGEALANALERAALTTPVAVRMLRVGEAGGNLGEMMERVASFYDEELSRWILVLTRVIEPALMSLIGLMIGIIVVLLYFPIFELAGSIQ